MDLRDFPPHMHSPEKLPPLEGPDSLSRLEEMEKKEVVAALERNRWIQSQAARELGLTLRQMGYRIKKFGLDDLLDKRRRRSAGMREKQ